MKYTADWKNGYNAEVSYEGKKKWAKNYLNLLINIINNNKSKKIVSFAGEARYPDAPQGPGGSGGYRY